MSKIKHICGWTVDFISECAYIRLSETEVLRSNGDGQYGILSIDKLPERLIKELRYAEFDQLEHLPFVERFGKARLVIR